MTKKQRIIERLRLDEISWVDKPAQEPARITIRKHDVKARTMKKAAATAVENADSFGTLVNHFEAAGMSKQHAMRAARSARPELFKAYQEAGAAQTNERLEKHHDGLARRKRIDALVDDLVVAKGGSRVAAMRTLRQSNPELFEAN